MTLLAQLLIYLFFVLLDGFLIVSIISFINLCILSWIYERDDFDYEEDSES